MEKYNTGNNTIPLGKIKSELNLRESEILSPTATLSQDGIRRKYEEDIE